MLACRMLFLEACRQEGDTQGLRQRTERKEACPGYAPSCGEQRFHPLAAKSSQ